MDVKHKYSISVRGLSRDLKPWEKYVWASCYKEAMEWAMSLFPGEDVEVIDTGETFVVSSLIGE